MKEIPGILNYIGNTPLVEVKNIFNKPKVKILLKLEGDNPGGSVKDRAAFSMINEALKRGDIKKGDHIIEATSGNTGIALAYISRLLGLKISIVMPENSTVERIKTMRLYGAEVILTDKESGIEGSRDLALSLSNERGYYILNQFENDDNWKAHYETTGPEIWNQTDRLVTHFVSAMGTTGTIMGVSKFLKEQNENVQIIGCQPKDGANIPGIRKWGSDYTPLFYNKNMIDNLIEVDEDEAVNMIKRLAKEEGVFAGISSGGAFSAALKVASQLDEGVVVAIVCDRGDRYLSSPMLE